MTKTSVFFIGTIVGVFSLAITIAILQKNNEINNKDILNKAKSLCPSDKIFLFGEFDKRDKSLCSLCSNNKNDSDNARWYCKDDNKIIVKE